MPELAQLLPFVAFALIFWLLLVRPAQRQRRQVAAMQAALAVGDPVILTSGIHGRVLSLADHTAEVEVASGVALTVARGAIGQVVGSADSPATGSEQ